MSDRTARVIAAIAAGITLALLAAYMIAGPALAGWGPVS